MAIKKEDANLDELSYLVDDALEGFEKLDQSVIALPFIRILQSLSPQLKKTNPEYIAGAEEGALFNNITKTIYDQPLRVVPLKFDRQFICWKPDRAGYGGAFSPEWVASALEHKELFTNEKGQIIDGLNNSYMDTYTYYIFPVDYRQEGVCLLTFSSTQLKEARRWNRCLTNTLLPNGKRAMPYHTVWNVATVPQQNKLGEWYGYNLSFEGFVQKDTFALVQQERQEMPALASRVDYSTMAIDAAPESPALGHSDIEDIPF